MSDGTGIVHIAPAFGQDDANVGKKYDLPFPNPVAEDATYIEGPWKGMKVFDADVEVIKYLKTNDKLFKKQKWFTIILTVGVVIVHYYIIQNQVIILK